MIIIKYVGSKNRLSKHLTPIIQSYITNETVGYLEPFVGGANMIDKIKCDNKIGYDVEENIINLLCALSDGWNPPKEVNEDMYKDVKLNPNKYDKQTYAYVGYQLSYGAKFWGGYRRDSIGKRQYDKEAYNNVTKQSPQLKGIEFDCMDFRDIPKDEIKGYVIYCDPPYRGTTKYKTEPFPYDEFYEWVKEMSIHNTVLISEYWMPDDFECIWQKETTTQINSKRKANDENNMRVEKLYTYKAK